MAAPSRPRLHVVKIGSTTVTVAWAEVADGGSAITGYNLFAGTPPTYPPATPTSVDATRGHATFTGLDPDTDWYLLVTAENDDGESPAGQVLVHTADLGGYGAMWIGDGYGNPPPTGGLCVRTDDYALQIGTVSFASRALWATDLWELELGADLKGTNTPRPNAPGNIPNRNRQAQTSHDISFLIDSQINPATGLPHDCHPSRAFTRTLKYLRRTLIDPTSARTTPAWLFSADDDELPASCQVKRVLGKGFVEATNEAGALSISGLAVMQVVFPFGGFNFD